MTKLEEIKNLREQKKKQRMMKFMNGANYSNRLIRSFNNLKKRENDAEIKILRSTNNLRKNIVNTTTEQNKTKLSFPYKNTINNQDKGQLEFVPFWQERDGMGKLIVQDKDDFRKVKIIRLNTKANHRDKDFSNSVDMKNSLTHIVYNGVIDTKYIKESGININTITSGSFFMNDRPNNTTSPSNDTINYSKFEIQKKFEPFYKPPTTPKENSSTYNKTSSSFRPGTTTETESRREKLTTPCIGSYDCSYEPIYKKITRTITIPIEHPDYDKFKNKTATMMNLSDIYQKLETHKKLVEDFGKQIGRSQSLLKWAPAIHEMEKMKNKKKEQEFKEFDSKDLEKDYHFNRYLQKKYYIRSYVPPFTQDIKKSIPLSKDDFKDHTTRLIQKYDFKTSVPEFKRIFKVQI